MSNDVPDFVQDDSEASGTTVQEIEALARLAGLDREIFWYEANTTCAQTQNS